jgi:hypothetical protein
MVPLHINLKKALIIIGAFLYSSFLYTQTPGLGTWNVLTGRFNYNSKWHGFVELQLRSQQTYDHFNYHEVKGGIGYMITPSLSALIGTGRWSLLSGPSAVSFSNDANPNSNVSGLVSSSVQPYVFRWTVSNNPCCLIEL